MENKLMEDKIILTQEQRDFLVKFDVVFNPWIEDGEWIIIIPYDFIPLDEYKWIYDCPKKTK